MTTDPTVRARSSTGRSRSRARAARTDRRVAADGALRTVLLAACPLITLAGAIAGVRTYRSWKVDDSGPVWQGLLWFLLMTTLLLFMSVGPTVLGLSDE